MKTIIYAYCVLTTAAIGAPQAPSGRTTDRVADTLPANRLVREVRHELLMLPYYGVFDNLNYRVDGSAVTLTGQVTRSTLKSGAERVVKNIEGVDRVVNNIEVLPRSPNDDQIRMQVYRAIYGQPSLSRYAMKAVSPIHIIVTNGNVTLEGAVANETDKNTAGIQAKGVPAVFAVANNLLIETR